MWVGDTSTMGWYNKIIYHYYITSYYIYGAGRTQKTGAPWTGTPVTPYTGDQRLSGFGGGGGDRKCSSATGCRTDGTAVMSVRFLSPRVKSCTPWDAGRAMSRTAAAVSAPIRSCTCRQRNCISTPVRCKGSTTTSCVVTKTRVSEGASQTRLRVIIL